MKTRYIIGITGGSGAGKSLFAKRLQRRIGQERTQIIAQDFYYFGRDDIDSPLLVKTNFDHPDSVDFPLLFENIHHLLEGNETKRPVYSMKQHKRLGQTRRLVPSEIIIIEGTLIFFPQELRDLCRVRIFIDVPDHVRLDRRIIRDLKERGRSIWDIMDQFRNFVVPMYQEFVEPQKKWSHLVLTPGINRNGDWERLDSLLSERCPDIWNK